MATRLLAIGMDITDVQKFLGHEDIATTRIYAETSVAMLRRKFDQVTSQTGQDLVRRHRTKERSSAPLRPTCWQNQGALLYELLAHHLQVATSTESIIHSPPGKRRVQKWLAPLHALKGGLDGLAFVFCQVPGALALQKTGDKADDQIQVRPGIPARRLLPPFQVPWRTATILGRTGPGTRPCRRDKSSNCGPGTARCGLRALSSRPCRRGRQNDPWRET